MATAFRYRCCEHCVDDPRFHEKNPADSHTVSCSTGPHNRCAIGDQRVRFDTDLGVVVPDQIGGA